MSPDHRVVKPRNTHYLDLPIVAVQATGETLDENGEVADTDHLIRELATADGFLIVAMHAAHLLAEIQETYGSWRGWTSKTTRRERTVNLPEKFRDKGMTFSFTETVVHKCGWKSWRRHPPMLHRYSYFFDPLTFYGNDKTITDIFGRISDIDCYTLLRWGQVLRRFCFENDLPYKPTAGATSAQFLTDRRFYPEPRRKVPKATNDRLRTKMPGNYCKVLPVPSPRFRYNGIYLDQKSAHHYHAAHTRFPDANSLFAFGDFRGLKRVCLRPDAFLADDGFSGYILGDFEPPTNRVPFLPPNWRRRDVSRRFVSTAEWPFLFDIGVRCHGIIACWGSFDRDDGVPRFARHAREELDRWKDDGGFRGNAWLKPILLSTYGVLAVNANRTQETLYGGADHLRNGQSRKSWAAGDKLLWGRLVSRRPDRRVEPGICNVLHRALIEAATRTESISYANYLVSEGYRVLMIHVDGIIVEDDEDSLGPPPMLPPWEFKRYLGGIEFIDQQSFTSYQMTRMPGRPIHSREWVKVGHSANIIDPYFLEPVPEPA